MKYVMVQVIGMVMLVVGAQGAIRLLVDHDNTGLLHWFPGGFPGRLLCYALITLVGVLLAGWGSTRAKKAGRH